MISSLLLMVHVMAAVVSLIAGALAMLFRKGGGRHGAAGTAFAVSMLAMASTAAYIAAFVHPIAINVVVGLLTLYLVATGWRAAKNRDGRMGRFDRAAMIWAGLTGILGVSFGVRMLAFGRANPHDAPAVMYFVFGGVALLFSLSDVRTLARGSVTGMARIRRHLWRMGLALLIATASLYPGRPQVFSKALRDSNLLYIPLVLLIGALAFWLVRMRAPKSRSSRGPAWGGEVRVSEG